MTLYNTKWKSTAKDLAQSMRKKGYKCNVYKKKKGYRVSVRRK